MRSKITTKILPILIDTQVIDSLHRADRATQEDSQHLVNFRIKHLVPLGLYSKTNLEKQSIYAPITDK